MERPDLFLGLLDVVPVLFRVIKNQPFVELLHYLHELCLCVSPKMKCHEEIVYKSKRTDVFLFEGFVSRAVVRIGAEGLQTFVEAERLHGIDACGEQSFIRHHDGVK